MTSVQLPSHGIGHSAPSVCKAVNLLGFDRMSHGNPLKQRDFISHYLKVSNGPFSSSRHFCVSVEGLAAEDNARVCFGWGHGRKMP